jgi:sacsin
MVDVSRTARGNFEGQKTSIAQEIKRNLSNYADTQLLIELAQNADDAGATRVTFLLDHRQHGNEAVFNQSCVPSDGLEDAIKKIQEKMKAHPHPKLAAEEAELQKRLRGDMASLQGPALLSFDDAVFEPENFRGLMSFGQGSKKHDPTKTGKFGLGFNTCYHLTDVPMLLSGKHFLILDPQSQYIPGLKGSKEDPGLKWTMEKEDWDTFHDQFHPFLQQDMCGKLDPDSDQPVFPGTLFRFPLRTEEQAQKSELTDMRKAFSVEHVKELMDGFQAQAVNLLLFLNNLEAIEFWEWSEGAARPECYFEVRACGEVARRKEPTQWLREQLDTHAGEHWKETPGSLRQTLLALSKEELEEESRAPDSWMGKPLNITIEIKKGEEQLVEQWVIVQGVGQGDSWELALDERLAMHTVWPSAGVAARLKMHTKTGTTSEEHEHFRPVGGLVYTTVPTNIATGLPVHVNGCFLLSDNRRHLAAADSYFEKVKALWNNALISDACAILYKELLVHLQGQNPPLPVPVYYALWPVDRSEETLHLLENNNSPSAAEDSQTWSQLRHAAPAKIQEDFRQLLPSLYECISGYPVLRLHSPSLNFCTTSFAAAAAQQKEGESSRWATPCEGVYFDTIVKSKVGLITTGSTSSSSTERKTWLLILFESACWAYVEQNLRDKKNAGKAPNRCLQRLSFCVLAKALRTWIRRRWHIAQCFENITVAPPHLLQQFKACQKVTMMAPEHARRILKQIYAGKEGA